MQISFEEGFLCGRKQKNNVTCEAPMDSNLIHVCKCNIHLGLTISHGHCKCCIILEAGLTYGGKTGVSSQDDISRNKRKYLDLMVTGFGARVVGVDVTLRSAFYVHILIIL